MIRALLEGEHCDLVILELLACTLKLNTYLMAMLG